MAGTADAPAAARSQSLRGLRVYLAFGVRFGFQSFHMYGIIGTAILTAGLSLQVIGRFGVRALDGRAIVVPPKVLGRGTCCWLRGTSFGLCWALAGARRGPLFAFPSSGVGVMVLPPLAAVARIWTYGHLRPRLPHCGRQARGAHTIVCARVAALPR